MLFDSGAEMDALSPDFVHVCQVPLMELPNHLVLQMGTKGSRSCIYYRTNVNLKILGHSMSHYFNIVNVKKYDAILGTPWLNTTGALLDFDKHIVHCRWENGSLHDPPMETSFSHWNMSLLSQDENPIIGRIFAGNPNIRFFRIGT